MLVSSYLWTYGVCDGSNKSTITGLPGGLRLGNRHFTDGGNGSKYWSSTTAVPEIFSYIFNLSNYTSGVNNILIKDGLSLRCIKD